MTILLLIAFIFPNPNSFAAEIEDEHVHKTLLLFLLAPSRLGFFDETRWTHVYQNLKPLYNESFFEKITTENFTDEDSFSRLIEGLIEDGLKLGVDHVFVVLAGHGGKSAGGGSLQLTIGGASNEFMENDPNFTILGNEITVPVSWLIRRIDDVSRKMDVPTTIIVDTCYAGTVIYDIKDSMEFEKNLNDNKGVVGVLAINPGRTYITFTTGRSPIDDIRDAFVFFCNQQDQYRNRAVTLSEFLDWQREDRHLVLIDMFYYWAGGGGSFSTAVGVEAPLFFCPILKDGEHFFFN